MELQEYFQGKGLPPSDVCNASASCSASSFWECMALVTVRTGCGSDLTDCNNLSNVSLPKSVPIRTVLLGSLSSTARQQTPWMEVHSHFIDWNKFRDLGDAIN